jgi:hypothetical protein
MKIQDVLAIIRWKAAVRWQIAPGAAASDASGLSGRDPEVELLHPLRWVHDGAPAQRRPGQLANALAARQGGQSPAPPLSECHLLSAGVGSMFPAVSVARTAMVCHPAARSR